jgi:hypothetical protein
MIKGDYVQYFHQIKNENTKYIQQNLSAMEIQTFVSELLLDNETFIKELGSQSLAYDK